MKREALRSVRMLLVLTILTGIIYPLAVTGIAQWLFPRRANGSMVSRDGVACGSELIGQQFSRPEYFWPRPSAVEYNPLPSGGSNLGPTSVALKDQVRMRREALIAAHGSASAPPPDLLFASGSGLDPHITPEAAYYQVERVARARGWDSTQKARLRDLVRERVEERSLGFLGERRVNVMLLNLALDSLQSGGVR